MSKDDVVTLGWAAVIVLVTVALTIAIAKWLEGVWYG